jgi:nucleoid DNA-binding protein
MGLGKKDIVKNIYTKANISNDDSKKFLNKFFEIIIHQTKNQNVKLSRITKKQNKQNKEN